MRTICCSRIKIEPLFKNIEENDILKPVKLLKEYFHGVKYFEDLSRAKSPNHEIYLRYIQCRVDMICIISKGENDLLKKYAVIGKEIELNTLGFTYLLFQLYTIRIDFEKSFTLLKNYIKNNTKYHFYFIEKKYLDNLESDSVFAYKSETFLETVIAAKLILHDNKYYLENGKYWKIPRMGKSIRTWNQTVCWLYKNISQLDLERFLFVSGIVPMIFGLRGIGDVDMMISGKGKRLDKVIDTFYEYNKNKQKYSSKNKQKKILDVDILLQDYLWHPLTDSIFRQVTKNIVGKGDEDNFIFYPQVYYYFYGFKIMSFPLHVVLRNIRNRPRCAAELIEFYMSVNDKTAVPNIPKYKINIESLVKPGVMAYYTNSSIKFLKKAGMLENKNVKEKTELIDQEHFLNTIKCYLRRDYKRILSVDDIKKIIKKSPKINI